MANSTTTTDPQRTGLFAALRSANADELLAYNAVEEVRNMAAQNIDEKFEVQNAKFDAVNASINSLRWMTGGLLIPISLGIIGLLLKS
ncbi:MAG: hypothetical protein OXL36_16780 [Bryobacterales bacterium]|nr:hypothetical protein [Bryobacterales bacterium]MDE0296101.1 hypothetical protein [Bryobacterales bacterium]